MPLRARARVLSLVGEILFCLLSPMVARATAISSNGTGGGNWSDTASWNPAQLPTLTDAITILPGDTITVDINNAISSTATIAGQLSFSRVVNSTLTIAGGNVFVAAGGTLDMGYPLSPIDASTATLVLARGTKPGQYGLIVNNGGNFLVYGAAKTPMTTVPGIVTLGPGAASVNVADATHWQDGDQITIDGELATVSGLSGTSFNVTGLTLAHYSTNTIRVSNLSRSVVIRSSGTNTNTNTAYVENLATAATSFNVNFGDFRYLGNGVSCGNANCGLTFDGVDGGSGVTGSLSSSTFRNGAQIYLNGSSNASLMSNNVYGNGSAISLSGSSGNLLIGNIVNSNTGTGIELSASNRNILTSNAVYLNHAIGIWLIGNSGHNALTRNTVNGNSSYGIYISGSSNNILTANSAFSNTFSGFFLFGSGNTLLSNISYANRNNGLLSDNATGGNTCAGGAIGYAADGTAQPDAQPEVSFVNSLKSTLMLRNVLVNPTVAVDSTSFAQAGSYLVHYSTTPGVMQVYGDYQVSGSTVTLDYANDLYTSTSANLAVMRGSGSGFAVNSTVDNTALNQLVTVQWDAATSSWSVVGSSSGYMGYYNTPGLSQPFPATNAQFTLTITYTSPAPGDQAVFALLAASHDQHVQKKLYVGPSANSGSGWNNNTGRSKIEIASGAGFHAVGVSTAPTTVTMMSGSTYYALTDAGAFTVDYASFTFMDESGIQLSNSGPFSINHASFDDQGTGAASTSTVFSLQGVTQSTITLDTIYYGNNLPNTTNYSYVISGSSTGLLWTNRHYSGTLSGSTHEENDAADRIQWAPDAPPTNPTIQAVYVSSLSVAWDVMSLSAGFIIAASTGSWPNTFSGNVSSITTDASAAGLRFNAGQLLPNTTYFVEVGSLWADGTTDYSAVPLSTGTLTNLLSPAVLSVSSDTVQVGWPAFAVGPGTNTAEGYELDVSTSADFTTLQGSSVTTDVALSTLTIVNLSLYTPYFVRAGAINYNGVVNYTILGATRTNAGSAPGAPNFTGVFVTSASVLYGTAPNSQGYELDASTMPTFLPVAASSSTLDSSMNHLDFDAGALSPNTTFFIRVGALYNGATVYNNATPSTSTLTDLLQNPQIYATYLSSAVLNWTAFSTGPGANTAEGYIVQESSAADFSGTIQISSTTDVTQSTLTIAGLVDMTQYYFRVGGLNWDNVPNYSATFTTITGAGPAPNSPIITRVCVSSLTLSWGSVGSSGGYRLEASTDPWPNTDAGNISSTTADGTATALAFDNGSLLPDTTYFVRVGALWSGATTYSVTQPSTSTLTTVIHPVVLSVSSQTARVGWPAFATLSGTDTAQGYELDYSTSSVFATYQSSITTAVTFSPLTATGLAAGTAYYLRAGALNWNGVPNYGGVISTVTASAPSLSTTAPEIPEGVLGTLDAARTQMTFSWHAVTKNVAGQADAIDHYVVERSGALPGTPTETVTVASNVLSYTEAADGHTYYYDVKAVDAGGMSSAASDFIDSSSALNRIVLAGDDPYTRLLLPRALALSLLSGNNAFGTDVSIAATHDVSMENNAVLRAYRFDALRADTHAAIPQFGFSAPLATIEMSYPSTANAGASSTRGPPLDADASASPTLSLYWSNGSDFVPLGGTQLLPGFVVSAQAQNLGLYEVRPHNAAEEFSLVDGSPYPRILTPNISSQNNRLFFFFNGPPGAPVTGTIYDLQGAKVRDLRVDGNSVSPNSLVWDVRDENGRVVPSGIYLYSVSSNGKTLSGSVVVAR